MYPEVLKSKIMYIMIPYKSKVLHEEDDILNFSSIRHKIFAYPIKDNNFGDDSSMVLLYYDYLVDTNISGNTDLIGNIILESRNSVLSSPHIGLHTVNAKYRIQSRKT